MRAPAGVSSSPRLSRVQLSKNTKVSNYITRRVQLRIGQSQRRNYPIPSPFRRSQPNKYHLVFVVVDNFAQSCFQFNLFRWVQVALENGELKVVAKIATGLKHLPQPFVVSDIVTNQVSCAHEGTGLVIQVKNWDRGQVCLVRGNKAESICEKPIGDGVSDRDESMSEDAQVPGNEGRFALVGIFFCIEAGGEERMGIRRRERLKKYPCFLQAEFDEAVFGVQEDFTIEGFGNLFERDSGSVRDPCVGEVELRRSLNCAVKACRGVVPAVLVHAATGVGEEVENERAAGLMRASGENGLEMRLDFGAGDQNDLSPAATKGGFEVVCVFGQIAKFVQGLLMLEAIPVGEGFGEVGHGTEFGFTGGISDPMESLLQGSVGGGEGVSTEKFNGCVKG